jgi:hypothetical protein
MWTQPERQAQGVHAGSIYVRDSACPLFRASLVLDSGVCQEGLVF